MKQITPQDVSIVLFLLLWVAIILYIGAKRDLENQREATQKIYEMLTPQQKRKLQQEYEYEIEVQEELNKQYDDRY